MSKPQTKQQKQKLELEKQKLELEKQKLELEEAESDAESDAGSVTEEGEAAEPEAKEDDHPAVKQAADYLFDRLEMTRSQATGLARGLLGGLSYLRELEDALERAEEEVFSLKKKLEALEAGQKPVLPHVAFGRACKGSAYKPQWPRQEAVFPKESKSAAKFTRDMEQALHNCSNVSQMVTLLKEEYGITHWVTCTAMIRAVLHQEDYKELVKIGMEMPDTKATKTVRKTKSGAVRKPSAYDEFSLLKLSKEKRGIVLTPEDRFTDKTTELYKIAEPLLEELEGQEITLDELISQVTEACGEGQKGKVRPCVWGMMPTDIRTAVTGIVAK
jgi:hypothetical protein